MGDAAVVEGAAEQGLDEQLDRRRPGVRSSWETLATKSRRTVSSRRTRVSSRRITATSTAVPVTSSTIGTALARTWRTSSGSLSSRSEGMPVARQLSTSRQTR